MLHTCSKCGYKERGLAITKKMIREVEQGITKDNWYTLKSIQEQSYFKKDRQGNYIRILTPNQLAFVKACVKNNVRGLILNDWVKSIDFDKLEKK